MTRDTRKSEVADAMARGLKGRATVHTGLTVCVCSARPSRIETNVGIWRDALGQDDDLLIVLDGAAAEARVELPDRTVGVVSTGGSRGLSAARKIALEQARSRWVVFLDDDATASLQTLELIRGSFVAGAHAVGVRLVPEFVGCARPIYLTDGLLHYIGVHSRRTLGAVWGACFGVDSTFASTHRVSFQDNLGRRGRQLQSGDDTTFVERVRESGGRVVFLDDATATHLIDGEKLSLVYLLRRAWWQGRSEVRRTNALLGIAKELDRLSHDAPLATLPLVIALFGSAVASGVVFELLAQAMVKGVTWPTMR